MTTFELNGLTYITSDEYMKMLAFIPQSVFYSDNKTLFNGKLYYKIKTSTFLQIKKKYDKHVLFNTKLEKCAELNNKGIQLEKNGKIDEAIQVYETNIDGDCYHATHSFDRLMVLYRKRKDYVNEIRVIKKAIKIFKMPKYEERLKKASELLTKSKK